jgi:oligopeptide transport system substrate-binding protein
MKKIFVALLVSVSLFGAFADASMIINNGAEPQSLDPALIQGVPEQRINTAIFEGLLRYNPKTALGEPGLAESWTVSKDKLTYTFKLRANAVWSDGTPITAQTVVDSWLRSLDPATGSEYAYMMGMVVKGADDYNSGKGKKEDVAIKAVDDHTFQMTLVGPTPYALDMLPHQAFDVVPMHAIAKYGKDWTKPENFVGDGPYIVKEWKPQEQITVVKNPKYWDAKSVLLDSIEFLPIDDNNTGYQKYKNGEIDWVTSSSIPVANIDELKLRKDYQVSPQVATYYYIFNVTKKPVDDVRVRKALSMALNTKELVDKVTKGGELVATSIAPAMPGYTPAKGNAYNEAAAKKLLAQAGYPDGKGFPKLTVIYNTNDTHKKIAEWVQQKWKTVLGIDVELQNIEWKTFLDIRNKHDFVISRAGWVGDYQDPNTFLDMFLKDSGNNNGAYNNPKYDDLVTKAATQSGAERFKTLNQAEEILMTQDEAVAPLYFYVNQDLIDLTKWSGWYANPLGIHSYVGIKKVK